MADDTYSMIAMQVYGTIDGVPTIVSGNNLLAVVDRARIRVENYTGLSVGSPTIPDRFKPAVMNIVLSQVCRAKVLQGVTNEVKIGDFDVSNRQNQASVEAQFYEADAIKEMATIGRATRYGRTY